MGGKRHRSGLEESGSLRVKVEKGNWVTAQLQGQPFVGRDNKIHLNAKKIQNWVTVKYTEVQRKQFESVGSEVHSDSKGERKMKTSEYCVERKREDEGNSNTETLLNFAFEVKRRKTKDFKGNQLHKPTSELAPLLYKQSLCSIKTMPHL